MKCKHPLTLLLNRQKWFVGVYLTFFILIQTYVVDTHNVCFEQKKKKKKKKKKNPMKFLFFYSFLKKKALYIAWASFRNEILFD